MKYRSKRLHATAVEEMFYPCRELRVRRLYLPRRTKEFRQWSVLASAEHNAKPLCLARQFARFAGHKNWRARHADDQDWMRRLLLRR